MAIYNIGNLIRERREELGLTQEELSEGICSVATLSRVENSTNPPTRAHAQALLQRLGYSEAELFLTSGDREFKIVELQNKCRFAYIRNDMESTKIALEELSALQDAFSPTDRQYFELMTVNIHLKEMSKEESLERYENALRITHPSYRRDNLPAILTYEEITALNCIAVFLDMLGQREDAVRILYHLKRFYERGVVDEQEALRTQPMILYNLSKILGLLGRYDECIEVSEEGINIAKRSGRCLALARTMYNRAWSMVKRGRPEDREPARRQLHEAYIFAKIMGNTPTLLDRITDSLAENFNETPISI